MSSKVAKPQVLKSENIASGKVVEKVAVPKTAKPKTVKPKAVPVQESASASVDTSAPAPVPVDNSARVRLIRVVENTLTILRAVPEENSIGVRLARRREEDDAILALYKARAMEDKNIVKDYTNELKKASKSKRKTVKPVRVDAELYDFLERYNVERDSLVLKGEVVSNVCNYIKENGLQDQENKKNFRPDATLLGLFMAQPEDHVYTFLRVSTYISHHVKQAEQVEQEHTE